MKLRLLLDQETAKALVRRAVQELRPVDMQAEALLRQALGLPFPPEPTPADPQPEDREVARCNAS